MNYTGFSCMYQRVFKYLPPEAQQPGAVQRCLSAIRELSTSLMCTACCAVQQRSVHISACSAGGAALLVHMHGLPGITRITSNAQLAARCVAAAVATAFCSSSASVCCSRRQHNVEAHAFVCSLCLLRSKHPFCKSRKCGTPVGQGCCTGAWNAAAARIPQSCQTKCMEPAHHCFTLGT